MALGMLYLCSCGERFRVYVPKQKLFRAVTGKSVNWKAIDAREEDEGDVEDVKRMADLTNSTFVDLRQDERVQCEICSEEMNLLRHFQALLAYSARSLPPHSYAEPRRLRA